MKLILAWTGLAALGLGLAHSCKKTSAPARSEQLFVGIDASQSARPDLGAYGMFVTALSQQLQPGMDRLTLYRVERATEEFRDGAYDGDAEALLKSVTQGVQPSARRSQTLPAAFWHEVARRAKTSSAPICVCLLTDGDNDDLTPASDAAILESARVLAACPQVRSVTIAGARPENWKRLRKTLAPLGTRLHLLAPSDLTPERALGTFSDK